MRDKFMSERDNDLRYIVKREFLYVIACLLVWILLKDTSVWQVPICICVGIAFTSISHGYGKEAGTFCMSIRM